MFKTRITEMAKVQYPVLLGGMQWLSRAELVAAVANAGGLAFITAATFTSVKELREEIRKTRDMTDKPFGLNISMLPVMKPGDMTDAFMDFACEEGMPIVETAGRSPEKYVDQLHSAGIKLFHKVSSLRFAKKAESIGADAVIVVGFECGGHPGMDDVPSLIQTPAAAEALKVPVIAAGGYSDGKGLVAALALGAEAVLMGTRFMASEENPMHDNFKQWMVNAQATDTMVVQRSINNAFRIINNKAARTVARMEEEGATLEELMPVIAGRVSREAYMSGDVDLATIACGQAVGRIGEIKSVAAIMEEIMSEARSTFARLQGLAQS